MTKEEAQYLHESALQCFEYNDPLITTQDCWAKLWVEAEKTIPQHMKNDFLDELTSSNIEYRHALEESVRWFGVRYEKD